MKLNLLILTVLMVTPIAVGALMATILLLVRTRRLELALAFFEQRYGIEMQEFSRDLDTVSQTAEEARQRITALEDRQLVRPREEDEDDEFVPLRTRKPTITERRHRVLSLARRGKDPRMIADTLGIPHGEVELMLNLHVA